MNIQQATQAYLAYLKELGRSSRTLYTYGKDLEQITAFFGPERLLGNILKVHVGRFYKSDELLVLPNGRHRARKTVQKTRGVFRQLMQWAQSQGYIDEAPILKEDLPKRSRLQA